MLENKQTPQFRTRAKINEEYTQLCITAGDLEFKIKRNKRYEGDLYKQLNHQYKRMDEIVLEPAEDEQPGYTPPLSPQELAQATSHLLDKEAEKPPVDQL